MIFALPAGFRPAANYVNFGVVTTGFSDFNEMLGFVSISDNGNVYYDGGNEEYLCSTA